jgi:hypothetical protein
MANKLAIVFLAILFVCIVVLTYYYYRNRSYSRSNSIKYSIVPNTSKPIITKSYIADPDFKNNDEILPIDQYNNLAEISEVPEKAPTVKGDNYLPGVNYLTKSRKNPSLDIRGDYYQPKVDVGPWNNSSIEPDLYSRTLKINKSVAEQMVAN